MSARPRGADEGFTLVELVVVVAILGVVVGALGGAMAVAFRTAYSASDRMDRSHDANLVATYLDPDLASATSATTGGTTCSGVSNRLALSWSETAPLPNGSATTTAYTSAYAVVPSGSQTVLRRFHCAGGGGAQATTVAHDLSGPAAVTVSVAGDDVALTVTRGDGDEAYTYTVTGVVGSRVS